MTSRASKTLLIAALVSSSAAVADTAYVKPSTFEANPEQTITVEVSFSDACCEPAYPVRTNTYAVINPDGTQTVPDSVESFTTKTVLEHKLLEPGTTRITTGERLGRKGEYVQLDGNYHLINSPDAEPIDIPEGTPILSSQTATVTDAYISIGTPSWDSVRATIGRLRIEPITHPSSTYVGETFEGIVMFDGQFLAGQSIILTTEAQRLEKKLGTVFQTDEQGRFTIPLNSQGTALLMTRMQAVAPVDAETDIRSYTTAITIGVVE